MLVFQPDFPRVSPARICPAFFAPVAQKLFLFSSRVSSQNIANDVRSAVSLWMCLQLGQIANCQVKNERIQEMHRSSLSVVRGKVSQKKMYVYCTVCRAHSYFNLFHMPLRLYLSKESCKAQIALLLGMQP